MKQEIKFIIIHWLCRVAVTIGTVIVLFTSNQYLSNDVKIVLLFVFYVTWYLMEDIIGFFVPEHEIVIV